MKAKHFELHKSFHKLSLKIHYQKHFNPILPYGVLFKFEIWVSKLLFSLKNGLNGNKPQFTVHKKNWSSKCFQMFFLSINVTTPYYHWVLYLIKIIVGRCISPYSLIMDCCKFFCTLKNNCSIMTIQNYSKNSFNVIILYITL